MILKAVIGHQPKLTGAELEAMSLYDLIRDERDFKIDVDERTFFHEPLFSVLEFVRYSLQWRKDTHSSFFYNTIESEENPLLAFLPQEDGTWKLYSVWQLFECDAAFSFEEVKAFIDDIIDQVMIL